MQLCQIAFSVPDLEPTYSFYQNCFKLKPSGQGRLRPSPAASNRWRIPEKQAGHALSRHEDCIPG
jgi:hypothetical protein